MTKAQASKQIVKLVSRGLGWVDQGLGHGHYAFRLSDMEYLRLHKLLIAAGALKAPPKSKRKPVPQCEPACNCRPAGPENEHSDDCAYEEWRKRLERRTV